MTLNVPQPTVSQGGATGAAFVATKPIELACGDVTFPNGDVLGLDEHLVSFGYYLYRQLGSGTTEVWDSEGKIWVAQGAVIEPEPLAFDQESNKWQMQLVAIGQKDSNGQDKIATQSTGFPLYRVRCVFEANDAADQAHSGSSSESEAFSVISSADKQKAGLGLEPKDPEDAHEVKMFLKDSSLLEKGAVSIRKSGNSYEIDISVSGASISITQHGDIELRPASGREVKIIGKTSIQGSLHLNGTQMVAP